MANFDLLQDENVAQGVSNPNILAGVSNYDDGSQPEQGSTYPTIVDPAVSWLGHYCRVECYLDSGIVVHTPLPQDDDDIDQLGDTDVNDPAYETNTDGVNLESVGDFEHVQQRMASSKYRFCLKGYAVRAAYQIPIPVLKSVGGVPAIPDDDPPARAFNVLVANFSGVPIFRAEWELWYTVVVPPTDPQLPPANMAARIRSDVVLPANGELQLPISQPDSNAVQTPLPTLQNPLQG